ncbi:integral membrane protein [Penicillium brasilianum]|uniref:Integral membrane protein n=1 Tax=Penicillium brasilianum TaxID=104259 RepID=A0A1S9RNT9_PENBI|nr:integral membrane protein [Penicillium brasilianum]
MRPSATRAAFVAVFLACLATAVAHGDDEHTDMNMDMSMDMTSAAAATPAPTAHANSEGPMSYFAYGKHSGAIMAHIALMMLGWCIVLPAAVMLSIGRSRLALPSQFLFLLVNAFGLLLGIVYNSQTPDLYVNNAHHKIGWIVTWVISAQVILALIFAYAGRGEPKSNHTSYEHASFLPVATEDHEHHTFPTGPMHAYRWSRDSGQGTEPNSPSHSVGSPSFESPSECDGFEKPEEDLPAQPAAPRGWLHSSFVDRFLANRVPGMVSNRVLRIFNGVYNVIDRIILPFGFIAIATGAVTYGGIMREREIFNGLAHFIKGGIFFWYGVLTLGRYVGCWADLGWAWNKKPPASVVGWKSKVPSGEFTESFVIWLYGVTNVFLEHLSSAGRAWSSTDLEHVSISIMFFGGGLAGMLFESSRIREALNNTILRSPAHNTRDENWDVPRSQGVPLNPMPALIILLLGMMMGSHHQTSMTSTMVHKQWGNMLVGFALARGMTYVLLFLRPPTSYLPARPPTEIVAAFCLMAGGLIFMLSTRNVIEAMEYYDVDAMFTFTVGMGFTAFVMALEILFIALKAWAVKREHRPQLGYRFP